MSASGHFPFLRMIQDIPTWLVVWNTIPSVLPHISISFSSGEVQRSHKFEPEKILMHLHHSSESQLARELHCTNAFSLLTPGSIVIPKYSLSSIHSLL